MLGSPIDVFTNPPSPKDASILPSLFKRVILMDPNEWISLPTINILPSGCIKVEARPLLSSS